MLPEFTRQYKLARRSFYMNELEIFEEYNPPTRNRIAGILLIISSILLFLLFTSGWHIFWSSWG